MCAARHVIGFWPKNTWPKKNLLEDLSASSTQYPHPLARSSFSSITQHTLLTLNIYVMLVWYAAAAVGASHWMVLQGGRGRFVIDAFRALVLLTQVQLVGTQFTFPRATPTISLAGMPLSNKKKF